MNRSKQHGAVTGSLAVLLAGLCTVVSAPPTSAQPASGIETVDLSGPVEPVAGWDAVPPTLTPLEGGFGPSPVTPGDAQPSEARGSAETVIGPDGRTRVTATTTYPASAVGQIEIHQNGTPANGGGDFICTGWLIDRNSILSAGHCVYDPVSPAGWIESATWYPGRNGNTDPFGGCAVRTQWAPPTEWVQNGRPYFDFAVLNFATSGPCRNIGATTGTFGLYATPTLNALNNAPAFVQGYPGDKPDGTQWRMSGRITRANKRFAFYPMDTFGGQSGSPVWWNRSSGVCTGPCGYAVHAYGVGLAGVGQNNNGGPRLTPFRLGQISAFADNNGT
jgi:V8-like Glu-specific endopeptidase